MRACRHKSTLTEVENNLTLLCERNAPACSGMGWPRAWGAQTRRSGNDAGHHLLREAGH